MSDNAEKNVNIEKQLEAAHLGACRASGILSTQLVKRRANIAALGRALEHLQEAQTKIVDVRNQLMGE
ncbi:MAG: hypothetical protein [Bacteriophage sp.]|nr:MAG: hypothetical protein [Bacteriophage sp.]